MRLPSVALAVLVNAAVREPDEWDDDAPDIARLRRALHLAGGEDVVTAAARIAFRVAHAQAFSEGNKRTALLLARWVLDSNGANGDAVLPPNGSAEVARLLIAAAAGGDVEDELIAAFRRGRG